MQRRIIPVRRVIIDRRPLPKQDPIRREPGNPGKPHSTAPINTTDKHSRTTLFTGQISCQFNRQKQSQISAKIPIRRKHGATGGSRGQPEEAGLTGGSRGFQPPEICSNRRGLQANNPYQISAFSKYMSNSQQPKPSKCSIFSNLKHLRRLLPWYVSKRTTTF